MFIFPVGKQKKLRKLPWVTGLLIIANIFVFFLTWPGTEKNYEELYNINSKIDTQKKSILGSRSELEALEKQQQDLSDLRSETHSYRYYASYYSQQSQKLAQKIQEKQLHVANLEQDISKLEEAVEEIKPQIPFLQYGYLADKHEPWRLLTYQFLHSGYLHLIFNMFFLWFVGCNLEDKWGKWYFLGFYLVSGVIAALINELAIPSGGVPLVGASGAIAGVMGAFMVRYPTTKVKVFYLLVLGFYFRVGFADWPSWAFFIFWFLSQFASASLAVISPGDSVAYWAHVGGFMFGALAAWLVTLTGFEKKYIEPVIAREEKALLGVSSKVLDAKEKQEEGNHIQAEKMLRDVILTEPDSLDAYVVLLGLLKMFSSVMTDEMKRFEIKIIELSARKNDENTCISAYYNNRELLRPKYAVTLKTLMFLGRIIESRGDVNEAAEIFRKIINEYSNDPLSNKAFFSLGKILIAKGQNENAMEIFRRLLKQPEGYHYMGRVQEELKSKFGIEIGSL
ncbi:MAG: hypothetical protein A2297_04670 [Elusimicrobia bacterium RIFOXYB2_FULL_48_7]|nr:MAG: hypothetical protein A2297_04670 [Elusimicrobia bacterium RIFOXYB2_FULL_48_7]